MGNLKYIRFFNGSVKYCNNYFPDSHREFSICSAFHAPPRSRLLLLRKLWEGSWTVHLGYLVKFSTNLYQ